MDERKYADPIYKLASNDSFMEVFGTAFDIGKVLIKFSKYNENGYLFNPINIYMPIEEFLVLAEDVSYGRIAQDAINSKKIAEANNKQYPDSIYRLLGGTKVEKLNDEQRRLYNNAPESRVFEIGFAGKSTLAEATGVNSKNTAFILFTAKRGKGETTKEGLIKPAFSPKDSNFTQVFMRISPNQIRAMFSIVKMRLQSYYTAKQIRGDYDIVDNTHNQTEENNKPTVIERTPQGRTKNVQSNNVQPNNVQNEVRNVNFNNSPADSYNSSNNNMSIADYMELFDQVG